MNILGAIVTSVAKLAGAVAAPLMVMNQARSITTQTKMLALSQQRDSDNREVALKRMEFDAKMEMARQAVRARERSEDREFSLSLEKMRAENLRKTEAMRLNRGTLQGLM